MRLFSAILLLFLTASLFCFQARAAHASGSNAQEIYRQFDKFSRAEFKSLQLDVAGSSHSTSCGVNAWCLRSHVSWDHVRYKTTQDAYADTKGMNGFKGDVSRVGLALERQMLPSLKLGLLFDQSRIVVSNAVLSQEGLGDLTTTGGYFHYQPLSTFFGEGTGFFLDGSVLVATGKSDFNNISAASVPASVFVDSARTTFVSPSISLGYDHWVGRGFALTPWVMLSSIASKMHAASSPSKNIDHSMGEGVFGAVGLKAKKDFLFFSNNQLSSVSAQVIYTTRNSSRVSNQAYRNCTRDSVVFDIMSSHEFGKGVFLGLGYRGTVTASSFGQSLSLKALINW